MYVRKMRQVSVAELDKYIIIDTHGGEEDILAIIIALKLAERYDKTVLGITCVNGRRNVDQAVHDALLAQKIACTQIPVYKGSQQSLLLRRDYPICHDLQNHSEELDKIDVSPQKLSLVQKEYAPIFIAEQIKKYSSELCIITFGPLTNLALAFHRNQNLKVVSSVRINGGAASGVGNVINSSGSEGNLCYDPHAGSIVISNFNNVYLNPIEKTLTTSFEQLFKELKKLGQLSNSKGFNSIVNILLSKKYVLCGPLLTIAPAFLRQTVRKVYDVYSQVINQGDNIVGLLAANWLRLDVKQNEQKPNVKIYSEFDLQQIQKIVKLALFG